MDSVERTIIQNGIIRIPTEILEQLNLKIGETVELRVQGDALVIKPRKTRRRKLRIRREIVDELVEHEELFEPEALG